MLFYGAAKAVDAAGRTALLEECSADGELTIVVRPLPCGREVPRARRSLHRGQSHRGRRR